MQFRNFYVTQMCFAAQLRIMIKYIPFIVKGNDWFMVRPALNRIKHNALVSEGTIRIITGCITNKMWVAGWISEIIFAIVFIYPRRFKETLVIIFFFEKIAILIKNLSVPCAAELPVRQVCGFVQMNRIDYCSTAVTARPRCRRNTYKIFHRYL